MDLTLGLVFICVFLVSFFVLNWPKNRPTNLPPGPLSLPLVGSISFLREFRHRRPHLVFSDAVQTYGDVMSFWVGSQLMVVLNGFDTVHEALVKQADVFNGKPINSNFFRRLFPEDGEKGRGILFNDYGQSWRSMRRFTLQVLRDFGVGKTSIEEKIFVEIDAATKRLEMLEGKAVNLNLYLQNIISNVIYGIVFGKRYDYEDPNFEAVANITRVAFRGQGQLSPANFLPECILRIINKEEVERNASQVESTIQMKKYITDQIDEHEVTFDKNNIRDFIDLYISAVKDGTGEETRDFDRQDILRVIMELFLAGSETSSTSLDWAFLYMAEYPEVQRKCQKEINDVFGDKTIGYADRGKLVFVEATLLEIQRIAMIVPINVPHFTVKDTTLHGYNIPKGTIVYPTLFSASRDPKYWTSPDVFLPERFIDYSGKLIKNKAMIPFSTGPRQCLGEPLARMELFLVFANFLQRFRFEPEDKAVKHSFESVLFQPTYAPLPFNSRLYKRS